MRSERGFTLVEVLVASTMMVVVLGAVLTTFNGFERSTRTATQRAEAQDEARTAVALLAKDIRNAVSAGAPIADSIERASADDIVFQTVGTQSPTTGNPSAKIRVRYCLDASNPSQGKLYRQTQVFPGAPTTRPTGTACPGPSGAAPEGWTATRLLTDRITNRLGGQNRPLFAYRFTPDASTALSELVAVTPSLFLDVTPAQNAPAEVPIRTAIQLRNANQPPIAMFSVSVQARKLVVNASASIDPERQPLRYEWYIDGVLSTTITGFKGEVAVPSGSHTVRLVVKDQASATNETSKTVTVPT